MELKYKIYYGRGDVQLTFNRTAYGIEMRSIKPFGDGVPVLLIAPLMELKSSSSTPGSRCIRLLIAPLMELKFNIGFLSVSVNTNF